MRNGNYRKQCVSTLTDKGIMPLREAQCAAAVVAGAVLSSDGAGNSDLALTNA
ncbi:MAG: hypothetical protein WAN46_16225 [Gammaproteobacteria bacterium]|jgi:hypothetical protein